MRQMVKAFWNEPSVAVHLLKGAATAAVAAIVLWPLSANDAIVIASALGLAVPAGLGARALTRPAKPRR